MIRIDIKSYKYNIYNKNGSLLPSNAILSIASYIDERILKEISVLYSWDSILIESPLGEFSPWISDYLRQVASQRRSETIDDELIPGRSFGRRFH